MNHTLCCFLLNPFLLHLMIFNGYYLLKCKLLLDFRRHGNCQIEWKFILHAARAVINPAQTLMKFISFNSGTMKYILHKKCFTYVFLWDQVERKEKEGKVSSWIISHNQKCREGINLILRFFYYSSKVLRCLTLLRCS